MAHKAFNRFIYRNLWILCTTFVRGPATSHGPDTKRNIYPSVCLQLNSSRYVCWQGPAPFTELTVLGLGRVASPSPFHTSRRVTIVSFVSFPPNIFVLLLSLRIPLLLLFPAVSYFLSLSRKKERKKKKKIELRVDVMKTSALWLSLPQLLWFEKKRICLLLFVFPRLMVHKNGRATRLCVSFLEWNRIIMKKKRFFLYLWHSFRLWFVMQFDSGHESKLTG